MMRNKPDKQFSPNTPKYSNMTLYEMAVSMSEDGDAQAAFPYLITWLLKDFFNNYRYNDIRYSDEYAYNIAYFLVYNFINREVCSSKPDVFRTKLLTQLVNMNLDHDFNNILQSLKDATVDLKRIETVNNTKNIDKTSLTTNNLQTIQSGTEVEDSNNVLTHNVSDKTTNNLIDETTFNDETNSSSNASSSGSSEHTASGTNNGTSSSNSSNTNRTVRSDYPQSTVDTSVPLDWDYASGAQDVSDSNNSSSTSTDTTSNSGKTTSDAESSSSGSNKHTGTETLEHTGTVESLKTGTDSNKNDSTITKNNTTRNEGTSEVDDIENSTEDISRNETWSGISGIELNSIQLNLINKYGSFYSRMLNKLETCFISVYIDDDRDGYIDPSINLMSAWL